MKKEKFKVVKKRSSLTYLSDHAPFPIYLPNIHTNKDQVCDLDNIEALSKSIYKYLSEKQIFKASHCLIRI